MRWHRPRSESGTHAGPRVAFVMSGGGSLGAMQSGQLLALFEAGITPDLVIGVSAGALNGAAIAHQPTVAMAEQLATIWRGLRRNDIFCGSRYERAWHVLRRHPHLYRSDGLLDLVKRFLPLDDLSQLSVPFEAGTVNIDEARIDFHSTGNPRDILVASASLPGVFRPVVIGGSRHVDGGIAVNLPIQRALDLGAALIFAFDCRAGTKHSLPADLSALGVLTSSIAIAREILTPTHEHPSVVRLPAPDTRGIGMYDFSRSAQLVSDGYELVSEFLQANPELTSMPARSAA
jgi:NTE family protein